MQEMKYGKYFISSSNDQDARTNTITLANVNTDTLKSSWECRIIRINDIKNQDPIPAHFHNAAQMLMFFGTNQEDPFDLGAELEIYIGEEREKYLIYKPVIVFIPSGLQHGPIKITKIIRPFTVVDIIQGQRTIKEIPVLQHAAMNSLSTGKYEKYFSTGDPSEKWPGMNLGRFDDSSLPECYGCQVTWLPPENAPFPPHPQHVHDSAEFLIHVGTNPNNPFDLGAEVELKMGKDMEEHTITKPAIIFLPIGFIHGFWTIKRVDKPWVSIKVAQGPKGVGEHTLAMIDGKKGVLKQRYRIPEKNKQDTSGENK